MYGLILGVFEFNINRIQHHDTAKMILATFHNCWEPSVLRSFGYCFFLLSYISHKGLN